MERRSASRIRKPGGKGSLGLRPAGARRNRERGFEVAEPAPAAAAGSSAEPVERPAPREPSLELCVSTLMWAELPLEAALEHARAAGITAVEIGATHAHPQVDPHGGREQILRLQSLLQGRRVATLTADHPDISRAEAEGGAEAVDHLIGAVRLAKQLRADVVSFSLGHTEIDAWDAAWSRSLAALRQILHETRNTGVKLGVELHVEDVFDSVKKARRLLETIPDPRLGLTLDTSLLHVRGIQLRDLLALAGERAHHVHLRDATRRDPNRSIGRGEISFPGVFRALRDHGYRGWLSVELYDTEAQHQLTADEALAESVPRLREWLGPDK
jgi:sugar phosphate isomerase/epimerase